MNIKNVTTAEELDSLGSALTFEGLAATEENFNAVVDWMKEHGAFFSPSASVYVTKGKDMNRIDGLTGSNAYPDDCSIVSFRLDDIANWNRLIIARFEHNGRWLDDIRDNNRRREAERN